MNTDERKELIDGIKSAISDQNKEVLVVVQKHDADLKEYGKAQEGTKDAMAALTKQGQELHGRLIAVEQTIADVKTNSGKPERAKSVGELFTASDALKEFVARGGKGTSHSLQLKAITSLAGSGADGIWSDRLAGVVQEPTRQFTIRNLVAAGRTASNLIEWIREDVFTNAADVVSEGTQKPESTITYTRDDVPVRTIAHWIHATRQVLADFPQLQTLINGRLSYGLKLVEENQILLGDGTGENILGLIPQATAYNTALTSANDTFIDVIRHAMLQVRLAFYPPSGVVMTPTDWHHIELTKDNENRYLMANPQGTLPAMLWGLPVVESDAMPGDTFMVGAFSMAATLFDREDASIMVSTEDRDNFVKNMVTILCEERLALAVSRPAAFVSGGFPAGTTT